MSLEIAVTTAQGPARWLLDAPEHPEALLLLGHGAGGGVETTDLVTLATVLPGSGVAVGRFEQPWRTAGRRVAVRPPLLDEAWLEAVPAARSRWPGLPLVVGGRSAGARVACRTALDCGALAVLCLSFPLHLPGRDVSRLPELLAPPVPRVVLQGAHDRFGGAEELRTALRAAGARVVADGGPDAPGGPDSPGGPDAPGSPGRRAGEGVGEPPVPLSGDVVQVREVAGADHDLRPARRSGLTDHDVRARVVSAAGAAVTAALATR